MYERYSLYGYTAFTLPGKVFSKIVVNINSLRALAGRRPVRNMGNDTMYELIEKGDAELHSARIPAYQSKEIADAENFVFSFAEMLAQGRCFIL